MPGEIRGQDLGGRGRAGTLLCLASIVPNFPPMLSRSRLAQVSLTFMLSSGQGVSVQDHRNNVPLSSCITVHFLVVFRSLALLVPTTQRSGPRSEKESDTESSLETDCLFYSVIAHFQKVLRDRRTEGSPQAQVLSCTWSQGSRQEVLIVT